MQRSRSFAIASASIGAIIVSGMALPSSQDPPVDLNSPSQVAAVVDGSPGLQLYSDPDSAETPANSETDEVTVDLVDASVVFTFPSSDQLPVELADGSVVFTARDESYASILATQDAAAQVTTVIASEASPLEYVYGFDGDVASLVLNDVGEVITFDTNGEAIGAIEAPWAFDADGQAVPTWYVVDGLTLTQFVDHRSGEFSYPLVADPTWSGKVLLKAFISDYHADNPGRKLSVWLSAYGRSMYAEGKITQFSNEGWNLLVGSFGTYMPVGQVRNSMNQQWRCHVVGGFLEYGTWDLETARPSNPNWASRIGTVWPVSATCNW